MQKSAIAYVTCHGTKVPYTITEHSYGDYYNGSVGTACRRSRQRRYILYLDSRKFQTGEFKVYSMTVYNIQYDSIQYRMIVYIVYDSGQYT